MKRRGLPFRSRAVRSPAVLVGRVAAIAAAMLVGACAWDPWIPGERNWNPPIVVNEGDLVDQLALDSRHVGELACYTRLCEKRFRIVLEQSGDLAVSLLPELGTDDDQVRLVLEGIRGVIARDGTGRGPHPDVPALAVSETVSSGIYFVLIQSVGSSIPFQLTARLTPREDAMPPLADPVEPRVTPTRDDPPPQLVDVPRPGNASAGFDPAVSFDSLRTFRFPAPSEDDVRRPGAVFEQPVDRQLRRLLADALVQRGLRQASGNETADLIVDFSRGSTNRVFRGIPMLYERYGFGAGEGWAFGDRVDTRATLVVDLVDTRSDRIAWHARTTRGVGPGITPGERTDALLQESVTEVLAGFPPR
jgi:hypothetical protein